jgi:FtsP/CotA-like multicopper oxidase with cupredoxin domain
MDPGTTIVRRLVAPAKAAQDRAMLRAVAASLLLASACGDNLRLDPGLAPPVLIDLHPDPNIVEVELVAAPTTHEYLPGTLADVWAFRDGARPGAAGTIPGPLLEAKLGDVVIVHFRNELPEETTIHWHGLRVPNAADARRSRRSRCRPAGRTTTSSR